MDGTITREGGEKERGKREGKKRGRKEKRERPFFLFSIGFKNKGAEIFLSSKKIIWRTLFFAF